MKDAHGREDEEPRLDQHLILFPVLKLRGIQCSSLSYI